jgi:hypothetical protein
MYFLNFSKKPQSLKGSCLLNQIPRKKDLSPEASVLDETSGEPALRAQAMPPLSVKATDLLTRFTASAI